MHKKGKLLQAVIDDSDPDTMIGCETWVDGKIKTSKILPSLLGYEIDRRDRKTDPHGGVLIASKKDLQIHDIHCAKNCKLIIDLPIRRNFI